MNFISKKFTAMALASVMTLSLSTGVFAQEAKPDTSTTPAAVEAKELTPATTTATVTKATTGSTISVQLDGEILTLTDAAPVNKGGRTFVPGRAILEKLGAEVTYDEATNTITAKKADTTISIRVGNSDIMVTEGGETKTVKTDAAPFVEEGRLYVPTRFAAEVLGCSVGWDDAAKTVLIVDTDKMIKSFDGKFTMMDKYLAYSKAFSEKPMAIKGDFTVNYKITADGKTVPITGSGTIDGITDANKMDMSTALKLNLEEVMKLAGDVTDPAAKEMLALLGDIKMNFMFDLETGKYYIQSPLFETLMGAAKDTWIMIDLNEMFNSLDAGISFTDIIGMAKIDNFSTYMSKMVTIMPLTDVNSYQAISTSISMLDKMFGDANLVKDGDNYTSTFKTIENGVSMTIKTTFMTSGDKVVGYSMDIKISMPGVVDMSILANTDASNKSVMKMSMSVTDLMEMVMDMNIQYTATDKKPVGAPAKGSVVIPFMDLFR